MSDQPTRPITHEYWRHARSGEVLAVRLEGAYPTHYTGPIPEADVRADRLETWPYATRWVAMDPADYDPVGQPYPGDRDRRRP
ncbi:MAG TPA: hypothetical protein VF406_21305 [Thermodesulfobacteriota bacterium]